MKILVRLFSLAVTAICILAACEQPEVKEPVKIRLNKELISSLHVGETQKLEVTVTPADAQVTLVWVSDNESVAVVDDEGNVTGVVPGTAEVSVTADEAVAKCKVVVCAIKPQGLGLDAETLDMAVGQTHQLKAVVTPEGAVAEDVQWTSSKESVATVKDGIVTAVSEGKAVIAVSCNGGKLTAECEVTVSKQTDDPEKPEKVLVSSITMPEELQLNVGASSVLTVSVLPENADDKTVVFSVEGDCVSVDETGRVLALEEGNAVVVATANDGSGVKAQCNVSVVTPSEEDITSVVIKAEGNVSDLQVGKELQLYIECIPATAKPKTVSWMIDNEAFAQVTQDGVVTGINAAKGDDNEWGKVVVTVNADGITATHALRVIPRQPDSIEVDLPEKGYIKVGETWYFNPRVLPEGLGYTVYCSTSLPNGRPQNDAYGAYVSDVPGTIRGIFAVSGNENLVYDNIRKEVTLSVLPYYVESLTLPATMDAEVGGTFMLVPEFTSDVEGHEPTYKDLEWVSSDPSKATVDANGKVTALATGSVVITATTTNSYSVPYGQAQKTASCTLNITEATVQVNVGDYYYSDGTWSSELDPTKTVIGIVFARANSASSDALLAKDYPDCVHGLVLSTEEYVLSCTSNRSWLRADLISWMSKNGYNQWLVDDKYCGYNNTQGLLALNVANVQSNGDVIHVNHVEAVLQHREKVQAPAGASSWYVPSYMEMVELSNNLDVVNASLEKIGGTTLRRTYEYVYDRATGGEPIPTVGTAEQHYYYSNNIAENYIYAYNMNTDKLVNPKVSTSPWDSVSGEGTPLPVRVVLAF